MVGPCAPNGLTCIRGATDLTCACDAGAWRCSSGLHMRDMSRSD